MKSEAYSKCLCKSEIVHREQLLEEKTAIEATLGIARPSNAHIACGRNVRRIPEQANIRTLPGEL